MKETARFKKLLHQAAHSGSHFGMSEAQYRFIAEQLLSARQHSTLVIGAGYDSELWFYCSRGNLLIVENDPKWMPNFECEVLRPKYRGKVGVWLKTIRVPRMVRRKWDFVIVDGPTGFSRQCVGRQEPIAWSAQLGGMVFVHDYERPWERELCDHYLGTPDTIIPFQTGYPGKLLAVFKRAPLASD